MSIKSRITGAFKGLFGVSFGVPGANTWTSARDWAMGMIPEGDASGITSPYAQHPVVGLAISVIAEDAASVPWLVYPKTVDEESAEDENAIEGHPLLAFWSKPNPYLVGNDLFVATYTYLRLRGEAFWWYPGLTIGTDRGPRATRRSTGVLEVIDPAMVRSVLNTQGVRYFLQQAAGTEIELDPDTVTHFKRFNPDDQTRGMSPIAGVATEIDADHAAAKWNRRLLGERDGVPTGVIKPKVDAIVRQDEREDWEKRWNARYGGARRGVGVLPPGWDWQQIATSMKDMDYRGLRESAREYILASAGPLPPFLAGVLDKANYANAREQKDVYWHGTITRLLNYVQSVINNDFLGKVGLADVEVWPDWEVVKALTENLQEKVAIGKALFEMGFTKRQINERLELGIDVDELEDADVGYLPMGITPVDQVLNPPEPTPATPPVPSPEGDDEEVDDDQEDDEEGSEDEEESPARSAAKVRRFIIASARDLEARLRSVVRALFEDIAEDAARNARGPKSWLATFAKQDGGDEVFDVEAAERKLARTARPVIEAAIRRGGEGIMQDVGSRVPFDMIDPRVRRVLETITGQIKGVVRTVEEDLRRSISEGVVAGESPQQLAKRVQEVMGVAKTRSMTIARTEVRKAFSSGRNEAMSQAGIKRHMWLSVRDGNVRPDHQRKPVGVDGVVVEIGEVFGNTGCRYPNDPSGPAEQIINCRCLAVPVMKE